MMHANPEQQEDYKIEVLFENNELIAINKPHGLLVHRTKMAADVPIFALQLVRKYCGKRVYPVHRLDRKTSGVLLFAKNPDANRIYQQFFRDRQVIKEYNAIVRGWIDESGAIDYPLLNAGKKQEAITNYKRLARFELDIPLGQHQTSRYSHVSILPITGRYHQIRKHMAHIFHPVIGDRPHGCNKQNRLWKEEFGCTTMLLHARKLIVPQENGFITITAPYSPAFSKALTLLQAAE